MLLNTSQVFAADANKKFDNKDQRSAYALGASLGRYMDNSLMQQKSIGINLDRQQLLAGVQDAFINKSKFSDQEIETTLKALEKQIQTAAQLKMEEESKKNGKLGDDYRAKYLKEEKSAVKTKSGLIYKIEKPGQGAKPTDKAFVKTYNELKQKAGDDEPILFIDGVHPTQGTKLAYGWMPAGKKAQPVETTGSRTRLNIMGALNLNDIGSTVVRQYDSINSLNIARFFIAIRETYPIRQKVHIILDGADYHRAELVKDWAYVMNTDLHYLPPYSPNLNPIERLWKVMNEKVRNNRYFASAKAFRQEIHHFFRNILPGLAG